MAEQRNREGQQLGNYRLERLLGRGGFAEVYLGHHLRLKRQAAIKVLHAYLSEQEIDAFQQEAQIIAGLEHPHIVRVLDFDVQNGVPFLVMDYLPNGTLRQRHGRGEQVPLPTVVFYVEQVAEALQFAHEQRLIHRDVKPENMLIGRRNEVVLSDFGIAAIAHSTSSMTAQASMGTIPYMAPEQIQEHPRAASDQYALGIVVYEWLSGKLPVMAIVVGYLNAFLHFFVTDFTNPWWRLDELLIVTLLVLSSLGLVGLHVKQSDRARQIGLAGIVMLFPGNLGLTVYYILLFSPAIYPSIGQYSALFNVSLLLSLVGTMLVGIAIVRAGIFPRWTAIVLILSQIARVLYFTPLAAVPGQTSEVVVSAGVLTLLCVALAGCGSALLSRYKVLTV